MDIEMHNKEAELPRVVIGAGIYGLYSAQLLADKGYDVIVIETEKQHFTRASFINQVRVHLGYHYPRSLSTALKSKRYFERFCNEYKFSLAENFEKIYATSKYFSWTNDEQFEKFCINAGIPCQRVMPEKYFKPNVCDGAFITQEYAFDPKLLGDYFYANILQKDNVDMIFSDRVKQVSVENKSYFLTLESGREIRTNFAINTTYASINQILHLFGFDALKIKYELCEVILCEANSNLSNLGITVMDGPFFSIMPFGKTGYHSLTSVTFTPHQTSYDALPIFDCQERSEGTCSLFSLGNCNTCPAKPSTSWVAMEKLAKKYLNEELDFKYKESLFAIKPILMSSEVDDSRPTVIRKYREEPTFISVLSGKINTVFDLETVLL